MAKNAPTRLAAKFAGLRTADETYSYGLNGLAVADNVDISRKRKVRRRAGYAQVYDGAVDAAWADGRDYLFTSAGTLRSMDSSWNTTVLRTGLTASPRLAAERVGARIYYSNSYETGVIENGASRSFGLPPAGPLTVSATHGRLRAGRYRALLAWVRSDGQEGGADGVFTTLDVSDDAGIVFSLPTSADPDVASVRIYMTACDGEEFLRLATLDNGTSSFTYRGAASELGAPVSTRFLSAPFPFDHITLHGSRMVTAVGDKLFMSPPFAYELYDVVSGFLPMEGNVTMVASVTAGLWVGTDSALVFLRGPDLKTATYEEKANYGALAGAPTYVPESVLLDVETTEIGAAFMTQRGLCVGFSTGELRNLFDKQVDFTSGVKAANVYRRRANQHHLLSVVQS